MGFLFRHKKKKKKKTNKFIGPRVLPDTRNVFALIKCLSATDISVDKAEYGYNDEASRLSPADISFDIVGLLVYF